MGSVGYEEIWDGLTVSGFGDPVEMFRCVALCDAAGSLVGFDIRPILCGGDYGGCA